MNHQSNIDFTQRNVGIDLLRALTMFVMIFVNDFWKIHDVPHWLEHAGFGEDFMGLADVVFPSFLFVVGMSIPYAIERRYSRGYSGESTIAHILTRTFALLVMGAFITNSEARLSPDVPYSIGVYWILMVTAFILIWNVYPRTDNKNRLRLYSILKVIGVIILFFLAITYRSPKGGVFGAHWGILGSIGWSYLFAAMVYVFMRDNFKKLIPVWIALVVISIIGTPLNEAHGGEPILKLPWSSFYHGMLNILHISNGTLHAFTMGGLIFSLASARLMNIPGRKRFGYAALTVALLLLAGYASRHFWILAKLGATPPWLFYVTGITIAMYVLLTWMHHAGYAGWLNIIKPAGTATLTCYLMPYLAYAAADITGYVLPDWFTHGTMGLINSLLFALLMIGITALLGRFHIKLKI